MHATLCLAEHALPSCAPQQPMVSAIIVIKLVTWLLLVFAATLKLKLAPAAVVAPVQSCCSGCFWSCSRQLP